MSRKDSHRDVTRNCSGIHKKLQSKKKLEEFVPWFYKCSCRVLADLLQPVPVCQMAEAAIAVEGRAVLVGRSSLTLARAHHCPGGNVNVATGVVGIGVRRCIMMLSHQRQTTAVGITVEGQPAVLIRRPSVRAEPSRGKPALRPPQDAQCAICLEGESSEARLLMLDCSHCYHLECVKEQLMLGNQQQRRPGVRITHTHLLCGLCRRDISITPCQDELLSRDAPPALRIADAGRLRTICAPMHELREQCLEVCRERARIDGSIEHLEDFDRSQANDSIVRKMACYRCSDCAKPFCGGKIECEAEAGDSDAAGEREDTATQALSGPVCDKCAWKRTPQGGKCEEHGPSKGGKCEEHGPSKAIFKCDCCCDVATFDCGGNHYCDECHKNPNDYKTMRAFCRGRPQDGCPLRVTHPPNQPRNMMTRKCGFVVGCVSCLGIDEHCQMGAVSQQTRARWRKAASVFRDES